MARVWLHTLQALPQLFQGPLQRMLLWGGGSDPLPCSHCPLADLEVAMEGFGGSGVMLEAGAPRCLLTTAPLHIRAKEGPPQVCTGCVKNLETTWLCVGGQKGEAGDPPLFFVLVLLCTWQLLQTAAIAWLRHESDAERSCSSSALTAGSCARMGQGASWGSVGKDSTASHPSRCSESLGGQAAAQEHCDVLCLLLWWPERAESLVQVTQVLQGWGWTMLV